MACWAEEEEDAIDSVEEVDVQVEEDVKEEDGAKETTGDGAVVARRQATADAIRGLMMYWYFVIFASCLG